VEEKDRDAHGDGVTSSVELLFMDVFNACD